MVYVAAVVQTSKPTFALMIGAAFVASYYIMSIISIHFDRPGYKGIWKKNGVIDIITSIIWACATIVLITSFIYFVVKSQIGLAEALAFYVLFIVLFAFIYRLLDWHFPGMLAQQRPGWAAEASALTVSIGAMTGGDLGSARPARVLTELIAALQGILGLLFVAIFIAQAVSKLPT